MILKILRRSCYSLKHNYFRLNEDDILHIVKNYLFSHLDLETSQGNLGIVQADDGTIHLVAAFGEADDDYIQKLELQSLANEVALNGPISSLGDSFHMNLNSAEAKEQLQKLLDKLEDEGI